MSWPTVVLFVFAVFMLLLVYIFHKDDNETAREKYRSKQSSNVSQNVMVNVTGDIAGNEVSRTDKSEVDVLESEPAPGSFLNEIEDRKLEQLKKYKELLDADIISREEFEVYKKRILG